MRSGLENIPDEKARTVVAELKRRFQELYGDRLVHVILYGSRARGDHEEYSDIDVLVVLKGPVDARFERQRSLDLAANLSLEHDTVVHRIFASEEEFTAAAKAVLENAREEGVLV